MLAPVHQLSVRGNSVCAFCSSIFAAHSSSAEDSASMDLMAWPERSESRTLRMAATAKSHCASMMVVPLDRAVGA